MVSSKDPILKISEFKRTLPRIKPEYPAALAIWTLLTSYRPYKKVKKKKKKKNLVAKITSLLSLSHFSCCHLTWLVISISYSSFLSLPHPLLLFPSSHVLSHTTLYFSFILSGSCGSWFMSHLTSHVNLNNFLKF